MVFSTSPNGGEVCGEGFIEMCDALGHAEVLRNSNHRFVTMVSENPNQIGKMGVDSVIDGKLPSGEDYTWKKRRI